MLDDRLATEIRGLGGGDWILAGEGNDTIKGGDGYDRLFGEEGNDSIEGGNDDDDLVGGEGDDWLDGGSGNDALTGGAGADMFVFEAGHGNDIITDFGDGEDLIDITALTDITEFNDLNITASGNDVVIDLSSQGGGYIHIENIAVDDLDTDDFCFYEAPPDSVDM